MKSWSFLGGPGSIGYRVFDLLRRLVNGRLVSYLCETALHRPANRVLEAGSGPGFASSLLSSHRAVCLSVALDIDIEALKEARQRDPKLAVVVADLYALPFSAGTFDLVWSNSTIEHLNGPLHALAEMRRVTRQGGYLFVGVPYRRGPLWFQPWIAKTRLGIWLGPVFGNEQLLQMADQLRLRVVETKVYFFRFFVGMLAKLA